MKAICLEKQGGPESLIESNITRSEPGAGEVLVRVHATAVTPTELLWFPTFHLKSGEPRPFPIVLSHEFSGTVEALGPETNGLTAGQTIYGINDWFANGALAEYCVAPVKSLAPKPRTLDHIQAAVTPISALTAWQGLFIRGGLQRGQRVLIHGAAGGVGVFAVQMARWRGAHVTATASAPNVDFVRALGADQVIDYQATPIENVMCDVDLVFDGVGGETLARSWRLLKPGGKVVTIATQSSDSPEQRVRDAFVLIEGDGSQLAEIGKLIDAGVFRVFVAGTFRLNEASQAYARASQGKLRGKIALAVIEKERAS